MAITDRRLYFLFFQFPAVINVSLTNKVRFGILRALGEGQLFDLLVEVVELGFLGIEHRDLALILGESVLLDVVLSCGFKSICKQYTRRGDLSDREFVAVDISVRL